MLCGRTRKLFVTMLLTSVTVSVTYTSESRPIGRALAGRPERGGECGTRGRACTLLPGGFGHHPLGTRTGVRGARWTTGQAGAGNTRSTQAATSQEAWPEAELLEMKHSSGREPWWNAIDVRLAIEARPWPQPRQNTNCVCRRSASDSFLSFPVRHPCRSDACTALPPAFVSGAAAWTLGSSPVVTSQKWRVIARALSRAARTRSLAYFP